MIKIVIIGAGNYAAEVASCFDAIIINHQPIEVKGYIDYEYNIEKYWKKYKLEKPVLGDIDNYQFQEDEYYIIGMFNFEFRKKMINQVKEKGGKFLNLIHPTAIVERNAIMGTGNIFFPYSFLGANAQIGDFNTINLQSIVSHDCRVGSNNTVATAVLCGNVHVGDDNLFGIRSTILPGVKVGSRNTIQAGMTVDKDVSDDSVIFHRFKEKITVISSDKNL